MAKRKKFPEVTTVHLTGVETVAEGEVIRLVAGPQQDEVREFTVKPKCSEDRGRWLCVTHDKVFWNNCEKDSHLERGAHVVAWFCAAHGPEVP